MPLHFVNPAMLWGLLAAAVPVLLHLWNQRCREVIDWGAMMFLVGDDVSSARPGLRLHERSILAARMGVFALLAVGLARPYWSRGGTGLVPAARAPGADRTTLLMIDSSASMERRRDGRSVREEARQWALRYIRGMEPGRKAALLDIGGRSRVLVGPTADAGALEDALAQLDSGAGPSDLTHGLVDAFNLLERGGGPSELVLLTDGQRLPWHADEGPRWALIRQLHGRLPGTPRIRVVFPGSESVAGASPSDEADGALGPLVPTRSLLVSGQQFSATATLLNAGNRPLTRRIELLVDDRTVPGSTREVGPIPPRGRTTVEFQCPLPVPGLHEVSARICDGDDANPADNRAVELVTVVDTVEVLLVDGANGRNREPFRDPADFLRAALSLTLADGAAGRGVTTPTFRVTTITPDRIDDRRLAGAGVVILADVRALEPSAAAALSGSIAAGKGVMVVLGDRSDARFPAGEGWSPASPGELRASPVPVRPDPASFRGPIMRRFAAGPGAGSSAPLAEASILGYRLVGTIPEDGSESAPTIVARLTSGDPWLVERRSGMGRILLVTSPLHPAAGNLVVNPDFVPLVHEWALALAGAGTGGGAGQPARADLAPGEPWLVGLPGPIVGAARELALIVPDGPPRTIPVRRSSDGSPELRFDRTERTGVYRLRLDSATDDLAVAVVRPNLRESDPARLTPAEAGALAQGWPLALEADPEEALERSRDGNDVGGSFANAPTVPELWPTLVLSALAALCLESWLTHRLVDRG